MSEVPKSITLLGKKAEAEDVGISWGCDDEWKDAVRFRAERHPFVGVVYCGPRGVEWQLFVLTVACVKRDGPCQSAEQAAQECTDAARALMKEAQWYTEKVDL